MLKHDYAAALKYFKQDAKHVIDVVGPCEFDAAIHALLMMQKLQNPSKAMIDAAHTCHALGGIVRIFEAMLEQAEKEIEQ